MAGLVAAGAEGDTGPWAHPRSSRSEGPGTLAARRPLLPFSLSVQQWGRAICWRPRPFLLLLLLLLGTWVSAWLAGRARSLESPQPPRWACHCSVSEAEPTDRRWKGSTRLIPVTWKGRRGLVKGSHSRAETWGPGTLQWSRTRELSPVVGGSRAWPGLEEPGCDSRFSLAASITRGEPLPLLRWTPW